MTRTLEVDYQRALLLRLSLWRDVRWYARKTGVIRIDDRVFRASVPGQCDLYGIARGGQHYEVELKRWGKLSESQERWRDHCKRWEIPWCCLEAEKGEAPAVTIERWDARLKEWTGRS